MEFKKPMISFNVRSVFSILAIAAILNVCSAELPPELEKCKADDNPCIVDKMNYIVQTYADGNPAMGLQNLKKIELNNIEVSEADPKNPIQLNFVLKTANFYGLEKTKLLKTSGFHKDPTKAKFEVFAIIPQITIRGKYEANGKVLLLPLNGHGDAEIKLKNLKVAFRVKSSVYVENGKQYVSVQGAKVKMELDKLHVKLDNIFDGNKELSDSMNKVINENWRDVWTEVESGIQKAVGDILAKLIYGVLKKVPYDEFYSD